LSSAANVFSPLNEAMGELKYKMMRISVTVPAVALVGKNSEIRYMDPEILDQEKYIKEYINTNFSLIAVGEYSLPFSGLLLGFFKISVEAVLVAFLPEGKIGNLLAFRGVIDSMIQKIDTSLIAFQKTEEIENMAYKVIRLRKLSDDDLVAAAPAIEEMEVIAEEPTQDIKLSQIYPRLDDKYAKKKFSFKESLIIQFCDGQHSIDIISKKSGYSEFDVEDVISKYEKKNWLKKLVKK